MTYFWSNCDFAKINFLALLVCPMAITEIVMWSVYIRMNAAIPFWKPGLNWKKNCKNDTNKTEKEGVIIGYTKLEEIEWGHRKISKICKGMVFHTLLNQINGSKGTRAIRYKNPERLGAPGLQPLRSRRLCIYECYFMPAGRISMQIFVM
jgi:hypothetical protein